MSSLAISSVVASGITTSTPASTSTADGRDPARVRDAAQQFEALLMGQILRSARQGGTGWLGGEDPASECATDYAEQQFAAVLAQQGGLGIASLIAKGLTPKTE